MTTDVTAATLRAWPLPPPASEKHGRGVVLVVGGSTGTPGAVILAAEAALRVGAGKVRVATVASVAAHVATAVPEARVYGLPEARGSIDPTAADEVAEVAESADVVLVGSGLVDPDLARGLTEALLPRLPGPVVLDALGTTYVDDHLDLAGVAGPCVLTVNPGELEQVLGATDRTLEDDVAELVARSGAVVLLGGETKLVGAPGGASWRITAGGPGLATAGSGDVQAGLVAGLLARGAEPAQAAVWGAWLHATAGDRLAARLGEIGMLAREIAGEVPALLAEVG